MVAARRSAHRQRLRRAHLRSERRDGAAGGRQPPIYRDRDSAHRVAAVRRASTTSSRTPKCSCSVRRRRCRAGRWRPPDPIRRLSTSRAAASTGSGGRPQEDRYASRVDSGAMVGAGCLLVAVASQAGDDRCRVRGRQRPARAATAGAAADVDHQRGPAPPGRTHSRAEPAAICRRRSTSAQPGDAIALEPGATYAGPFRLPRKDGDGWIVIASAIAERPAGAGPARRTRRRAAHAASSSRRRAS